MPDWQTPDTRPQGCHRLHTPGRRGVSAARGWRREMSFSRVVRRHYTCQTSRLTVARASGEVVWWAWEALAIQTPVASSYFSSHWPSACPLSDLICTKMSLSERYIWLRYLPKPRHLCHKETFFVNETHSLVVLVLIPPPLADAYTIVHWQWTNN